MKDLVKDRYDSFGEWVNGTDKTEDKRNGGFDLNSDQIVKKIAELDDLIYQYNQKDHSIFDVQRIGRAVEKAIGQDGVHRVGYFLRSMFSE